MTPKLFALAAVTLSTLALTSSAHADGKAYQFIFDQRMSEVACMQKLQKVATIYELVVQSRDESGDFGMNDTDGERAGVGYYSQNTCHIYVF